MNVLEKAFDEMKKIIDEKFIFLEKYLSFLTYEQQLLYFENERYEKKVHVFWRCFNNIACKNKISLKILSKKFNIGYGRMTNLLKKGSVKFICNIFESNVYYDVVGFNLDNLGIPDEVTLKKVRIPTITLSFIPEMIKFISKNKEEEEGLKKLRRLILEEK